MQDIYRNEKIMRKAINYSVLGLIAVAVIIGGYFYWLHEKNYPSTDDAYIQAHVINIAPQINGKVTKVLIHNQQHVTKKQLLFIINPKPFQIALQKAQANLDNTIQAVRASEQAVQTTKAELNEREAQLTLAQQNFDRFMPLVKKSYYPKIKGDDLIHKLNVAKAALQAAKNELQEAKAKLGKLGNANALVAAAKAAVANANLNLSYTKIYAPANGHLAKMDLQPGQTVNAYQAVFSLVEDHTWWASANMKETTLSRIKPGQKAMVHIDMYPSHPFHGIVKSISPGSGSTFSLLPAENATGNWVKVVQRFPVRIAISDTNPKYPLRIGASCTVSIDTLSK